MQASERKRSRDYKEATASAEALIACQLNARIVGLLCGLGAKKSAAARGSKSNGEQVCHSATTYLQHA